jgi:hypothetical protein
MTPLLLLALSVPCVYWSGGPETRATLEKASIEQLCVPPGQVESWRAAGFTVKAISDAELKSREALPAPGVTARPGVASPTRAPWIVANGWRFTREPGKKYIYEVPAGKAALAAAEAFAYGGADVVLKVDQADLASLGTMLTFIEGLPPIDLPPIADFGVVDDGSAITGEVLNLLARRNLLYQIVKAPDSRFRLNIAVGSKEFPTEEAADPSGFALKVRRKLTDEQRSLRVYGSEVVICRLTGDADRVRLHVINYAGRDIEGLRFLMRGTYADGEANVPGAGRAPLADFGAVEGGTEFTLSKLATYAVIDLRAKK